MMQPALSKPTVAVVDDDPGVLQGVSRLLRASGYRVRAYSSAQPLLEEVDAETPDCIVLDVSMPDLGGLELQSVLSVTGKHRSIVFITGHGDVRSSVQAMKAGAVDFLTKPFDEGDLLAAVQAATERDRTERASETEVRQLKTRAETLTKREKEVMCGVVDGRLNKQIAATLSIAVKTVKVHRQRVMEKMQAGSLAELVRMAQRLDKGPA